MMINKISVFAFVMVLIGASGIDANNNLYSIIMIVVGALWLLVVFGTRYLVRRKHGKMAKSRRSL